ncbi:chromo domain-containing protein cec-1-like [Penaeus japonicus]|uniref:chromo domain-containing protein cec-1-like n=1 Tax=Penaeus japonicus TaxID=27405 RepID=UPI001C70C658|nr:chromo domain-containing protein cec-1-like [Penaeus japonicus]
MKTLSLLALLVGAVAIAEGYPSEEKHVDIANSRQKRKMPEEYMEGDMEDMFGPPPGGVVVMVKQMVDSPDCCKTKSCDDMKKCKHMYMKEEMKEMEEEMEEMEEEMEEMEKEMEEMEEKMEEMEEEEEEE